MRLRDCINTCFRSQPRAFPPFTGRSDTPGSLFFPHPQRSPNDRHTASYESSASINHQFSMPPKKKKGKEVLGEEVKQREAVGDKGESSLHLTDKPESSNITAQETECPLTPEDIERCFFAIAKELFAAQRQVHQDNLKNLAGAQEKEQNECIEKLNTTLIVTDTELREIHEHLAERELVNGAFATFGYQGQKRHHDFYNTMKAKERY